MKKLLALLLSALILATLFGCGSTKTATSSSPVSTLPAASPSPSTSEQTSVSASPTVSPLNETITFWYCYTDKIQENNENLTKQFNETVGKSLGITVKAEYQGDYAALSQKLKAAYVAGTAPAVTVLDLSMLQPYEKSGMLQPLDTYLARDKAEVKTDDFQPAFYLDSSFNGKTYSLPYLRSTPVLYLNTTLLKQAGLDPKGPATMDELVQYAKTVKEKTGKYGITFMANAWMMQAHMMGYGSTLYNDDATATNINTDTAKKIMNLVNDMRDDGSARVIPSTQSDAFLGDVASQNCAMWFYSAGGLTTFMGLGAKNDFDVTVAGVPKGTVNAFPTGGANLVMTSKITDNQKEAAWQFIKWMTAKDQTIKASTTTGYLPSRLSAASDPAMQAVYTKIPEFKIIIDQLKFAGGKTPSTTQADAAIVSALDSIWVNKADVNATLSALETKVNALLNQK